MDVAEYDVYRQHRSAGQKKILQTIEDLSELPKNEVASSEESSQFAEAVSIFTIHDYDDLLEERGAQGRCGYVLCSNKPRPLLAKASMFWQLDEGAGKYCSKSCARKSIHVQKQLIDLPMWERESHEQVRIRLLEYPQENGVITPAKSAASKTTAANSELAFERGESVLSRKPEKVMSADVVEKLVTTRSAKPPEMGQISTHLDIEGYETRTGADSDDEESVPLAKITSSSRTATSIPHQAQTIEQDDEESQWRDMFAHLKVQNG